MDGIETPDEIPSKFGRYMGNVGGIEEIPSGLKPKQGKALDDMGGLDGIIPIFKGSTARSLSSAHQPPQPEPDDDELLEGEI